jgi:hypothetical protein
MLNRCTGSHYFNWDLHTNWMRLAHWGKVWVSEKYFETSRTV